MKYLDHYKEWRLYLLRIPTHDDLEGSKPPEGWKNVEESVGVFAYHMPKWIFVGDSCNQMPTV